MLEIVHLRKQFEKLLAVDDVSLTVEQGQIVGLIGPNGSGKSTLLNVTAGSLPSDGGTVTFDGHAITNRPANQIFDLGLARSFQDP
ncbi:MAG: ATP-binding cassette domain-containing protein, partial [Caldilineaceae bacterium]|nr:ATP-binding cassette domain-containing protein [Caldilineaceae bacterium]